MSKATFKSKRGESGSQYRQCVTPCSRFITSGDTHTSVRGLLGSEARGVGFWGSRLPALWAASYAHASLPEALFEEGVFASAPRGAGPASADAERWLHSWGSQMDLAEGLETVNPYLCPHLPDPLPFSGFGSPFCGFFPSEGGASVSPILPPRRKMWRALVFAHSIPAIRGVIRGSYSRGCQVKLIGPPMIRLKSNEVN